MSAQSLKGKSINIIYMNISIIYIIDTRKLYEWLNLMGKVKIGSHAVSKLSHTGNYNKSSYPGSHVYIPKSK